MANKLQVFGPYEISSQKVGKPRRIGQEHAAQFWETVEDRVARKQGCYVFGLKAGKGFTPWYVGMTTKTFVDECFALHKLKAYNDVLFSGRSGTPVLFLIALPGKKNKIPKRDIDDIETFLIQSAKAKNPGVKNSKKTKGPDWSISGVVRSEQGKSSTASRAFKKMMRI